MVLQGGNGSAFTELSKVCLGMQLTITACNVLTLNDSPTGTHTDTGHLFTPVVQLTEQLCKLTEGYPQGMPQGKTNTKVNQTQCYF